jgi:hypothetical protein
VSAISLLGQNWPLLIPTIEQCLAPVSVAFVVLQLIGWGRALAPNRGLEIQLASGWGATAVLVTLWGIVTTLSLSIPAIIVALIGVACVIHPKTRLTASEWATLGRLAALILPLTLILLTLRPVLPDTMWNLLPNVEYLYDFGGFPRDDAARTISIFPGLPYNTQLVGYFSGWFFPHYPTTAVPYFCIAVQVFLGLAVARVITGQGKRIGWSACAWGILLGVLVNPGFRPDLNLSDYGEPTTEALLALAGWQASVVLGRLAGDTLARNDALILGLLLAAFVNVRQSNIALLLCLGAGIGLIALLDRRIGKLEAIKTLSLAVLPPAILYLSWRWYVVSHFTEGELKLLPFAEWQFDRLSMIIDGMADQIRRRATLFVIYGILLVVAAYRLARREFSGPSRLLVLSGVMIVLFNLFLVFTYISHFPVQDGDEAHSYFRYNTHLSLLVGLAVITTVAALRRPSIGTPTHRIVATVAILALVIAPTAFLRQVRYDLQRPRTLIWTLTRQLAERSSDDQRIGLVLPGNDDIGAVTLTMRGMLALSEPRRAGLTFDVRTSLDETVLSDLAKSGDDRVLVSCMPGDLLGIPARHAALLRPSPGGWQAEDLGAYAPARPHEYWQPALAAEPFCGRS